MDWDRQRLLKEKAIETLVHQILAKPDEYSLLAEVRADVDKLNRYLINICNSVHIGSPLVLYPFEVDKIKELSKKVSEHFS